MEEYTTLLRCPKIRADKVYSRAANISTFLRKLMNITRMSEQWVAAWMKQKGDSKCNAWSSLRDLILAHPDIKKRVDVFALSIYGLIVFPKALGYMDEAVLELFDRLDKRVTPVSIILAKAFRSLNAYRRASEGRFIGCTISGYTEVGQHFEGKMDDDLPESPRRGRRMESPFDDWNNGNVQVLFRSSFFVVLADQSCYEHSIATSKWLKKTPFPREEIRKRARNFEWEK
ncbi:hypothetical protein CXB51_024195 [Gossypium anomalum]|uniref:DUF7745 domain-containing protein n=1 Tax=Gossypium anomalum TaxID=47600 RepID=A0A8J5YM96_9ROSI|nr:hypothetical protein CXB51_024195 [Gossypium anomalum]